MIPYFPQPAVHLGRVTIHAYGALAVVAVLVSLWVIVRRGRRMGIGAEEMFRLWFWMYVGAVLGSHLFRTVFEDFGGFLADPLRVFRIGSGVSTLGAATGGVFAALLWCRARRLSWFELLRRMDIVAYAIPTAWMFGRLGCALAHDHKGLPSLSWIAVQFPEGPRYDLGLLEFLFLVGVVGAFWVLDRRPRPAGFFLALYGLGYGGFRLWLATLRLGPARFYDGAAGVLLGLLAWTAMRSFERSRAASVLR